jgi:hypothetical protein
MGNTTVLFSGEYGDVPSWRAALDLAANPDVEIINSTDAAKFLNTEIVLEELSASGTLRLAVR